MKTMILLPMNMITMFGLKKSNLSAFLMNSLKIWQSELGRI